MKVIYILIVVVWTFFIVSCQRNRQNDKGADQEYTCPMHPQILKNVPGQCPVCHMDLIPVKQHTHENITTEIKLSDRQMLLAQIRIDTIKNNTISKKSIFTGVLAINKKNIAVESARISGRIDRLYFKTEGTFVPKGAALYELYSEELNNAKDEYKLAIEYEKNRDKHPLLEDKSLAQAAKYRLKLWGLSDRQINQIATENSVSKHTTIYSNHEGFISRIDVSEGAYVMEQGNVMELVQMHNLWAEAQVYVSQLADIQLNDLAEIQIPELNQLIIKGKVTFENPEIPTDSRINLLRVEIPNPNGQLRAGMPVYIKIQKPLKSTLTLPTDALIRNGEGATVWLQKEKGVFISKAVKLGVENDFEVEILEGLHEGDRVVTSGAYLINSEYVFKNGADPMSGMHLDVKEQVTGQAKNNAQMDMILTSYLKIQFALSEDKSDAAYRASRQMIEESKHFYNELHNQSQNAQMGRLIKQLDAFSKDDLASQRANFRSISQLLYGLLKEIGSDKIIFKQYCPMADAYWLSDQKTIYNPYFGKSMLGCGEIEETIR